MVEVLLGLHEQVVAHDADGHLGKVRLVVLVGVRRRGRRRRPRPAPLTHRRHQQRRNDDGKDRAAVRHAGPRAGAFYAR